MWLGVKREDLVKPVKEKDDTDGAVFKNDIRRYDVTIGI
jgi:hypothetical protein